MGGARREAPPRAGPNDRSNARGWIWKGRGEPIGWCGRRLGMNAAACALGLSRQAVRQRVLPVERTSGEEVVAEVNFVPTLSQHVSRT